MKINVIQTKVMKVFKIGRIFNIFVDRESEADQLQVPVLKNLDNRGW